MKIPGRLVCDRSVLGTRRRFQIPAEAEDRSPLAVLGLVPRLSMETCIMLCSSPDRVYSEVLIGAQCCRWIICWLAEFL